MDEIIILKEKVKVLEQEIRDGKVREKELADIISGLKEKINDKTDALNEIERIAGAN